MENQYLVLEPFLFINVVGDRVFLYNSVSGGKKIFCSPDIVEFLNRNNNKLYVFRLFPEDLKNTVIRDFILEIKSLAMGFIYTGQSEPIQFSPVLKIQDVHKYNNYQLTDSYNKIYNSSNNIDTLFLYINYYRKSNPVVRHYFYSGVLECNRNDKSGEVDFEHLKKFIS